MNPEWNGKPLDFIIERKNNKKDDNTFKKPKDLYARIVIIRKVTNQYMRKKLIR